TYNKVEEQSRYLTAFRSRLVDGVLLFQAPGEDSELDRLLKAKKPIVFVGRLPSGIKADAVATDIEFGTRLGVEHLVAKGHRRIGLVTVAASMSVSDLRLAGWRAALKKHGIAVNESYWVGGEFSSEAGRLAANQLLDLAEPPTAIFSDNLVLTTGIVRALQDRRLCCPADVEVLSSDDAEWLDVFQPHITTVVQPSYQVGVQAAETLLKRIRYRNRPVQRILLRPELVVRT
ncbi:MAG TPA: substrate-binding domain-containing protein, partial [Bryobacteraceae bacterium]|nr:substrate-binding domain-containing protein [Bryobacteraceae bacterium]